jgi:transcription initiation factor IIE alpha subunit
MGYMKKKISRFDDSQIRVTRVKVYLALLQLGKATVTQLAERTKIDRMEVHVALTMLSLEELVGVRFTKRMAANIRENLKRVASWEPGEKPRNMLRTPEPKWYAV